MLYLKKKKFTNYYKGFFKQFKLLEIILNIFHVLFCFINYKLLVCAIILFFCKFVKKQ